MARLNAGVCIKIIFWGAISYGVYSVIDNLMHRSDISDSETELSQVDIGTTSYKITNQDTLKVYQDPLSHRYNFATGFLYTAANNEDGIQITPFQDLNQEGIALIREKACAIAQAAPEKYNAFNSERQKEVDGLYTEIQAFYKLNCK
jgi:hypothetical protein